MDMMNDLNNPDLMRAEEDMVWWSMILSNVMYAIFLALAFMKWGNVNSFGGGAVAGGVLSLFIALSVDMSLYAYSTVVAGVSTIVVDGLAGLFMGGVTGGVMGWVIGRGSE